MGGFFMHRFFSSTKLQSTLRLTEWNLFHQISHVFRSKKGDTFAFFEADGPDIIYEIVEVHKKEILLNATRKQEWEKHATLITVFQAFPNKIPTMELIVQKLVEIGVGRIIFFHSDRSQTREIPTQKKERIEAIAIEALEQSGNNHLPKIIYSEKSITDLLQEYKDLDHVVGSPEGSNRSKNKKGHSGLWIGPEGGWSDEEISEFTSVWASLWSFSKNILRLETASILGAWILSYFSDQV